MQNTELDKTKRMSCPWRAYTLPERHDIHTGSQLRDTDVEETFGGMTSLGKKWERMLLGQVQPLSPVSPKSCIPQLGDLEACPPAFVLSCVCLVWVCLTSTFLAGCSSRAGAIHESLSFPADPVTTLFKALCPLHDWGLDWAGPALLSAPVSSRGWQEEPMVCLHEKIHNFA